MSRACVACGGDVEPQMPASLCHRCHHERDRHRSTKARLRASLLAARIGRSR